MPAPRRTRALRAQPAAKPPRRREAQATAGARRHAGTTRPRTRCGAPGAHRRLAFRGDMAVPALRYGPGGSLPLLVLWPLPDELWDVSSVPAGDCGSPRLLLVHRAEGALVGDEIRACWQSSETQPEPYQGLFRDLETAAPTLRSPRSPIRSHPASADRAGDPTGLVVAPTVPPADRRHPPKG